MTGELPWQAWVLGGAVALWVAGFDLFYSLFDVEHDRAEGLHSWAVRFGELGVFRGARLLHLGTVVLLVVAGLGSRSASVLAGSRRGRRAARLRAPLVRPGDLRRLDAAFFTVNGVISVVFAFVLLDVATRWQDGSRGEIVTMGHPATEIGAMTWGAPGGVGVWWPEQAA